MSGHKPILAHVPRQVLIAVVVLVSIAAPYRYYTGTANDAFGVFLAGFLVLWVTGYAGQFLHEQHLADLEGEADQTSSKGSNGGEQ